MNFDFKKIFTRDLIAVALFLSMLAIIIVPLNQEALDFFISVSLAISFLILLISLYIQKPADLTTFPTLILKIKY
jgi:flagellar biosynthesis protein FlhA